MTIQPTTLLNKGYKIIETPARTAVESERWFYIQKSLGVIPEGVRILKNIPAHQTNNRSLLVVLYE